MMDNIVLPPIRPSCSKVATLNSPPSLLQVKQDSESIHNTDRFQHHMHVVDSPFVSVVRKTGLIPYLGYLEDEHIVLSRLDQCRPDTPTSRLIFKGDDPLNRHATLISKTFSNNIALVYRKRALNKFHHKAFSFWKIYSIRFSLLRAKMIQFFQFKALKRRFDLLRFICRRDALVRKSIRRFWRRQVTIRFRWWKYGARWQLLKYKLKTFVFFKIHNFMSHVRLHRRIWSRLVILGFRRMAILLIQKNIRKYIQRNVFLAKKTIKRFFLLYFGVFLARGRVRAEKRRIHYENETANTINTLAQENLRIVMRKKQMSHKARMETYYSSIKGAMSRPRGSRGSTVVPIFPTEEQLPDIIHCWTNRGCAQLILRERCKEEVYVLSRRRFRRQSPPPYWCAFCGCVSLFHRLAVVHTASCQERHRVLTGREPRDHRGCAAWMFAKLVVDAALEPLSGHLK